MSESPPPEAPPSLLDSAPAELASAAEHEAAWSASLQSGVPIVHVLRGTLHLDDAPLRRAALDAAFGVARAIGEIQRRMTVGARDPRLADRKRVERVARLPAFAPYDVDPESWEELAIAHDESARPLRRGRAWTALKRHEEADPDGFCRLMADAEGHDADVENLFVRATSIEDALAFAAASREIWRRFFGSPHPLPSLPIHAAWLPLSRVYDPFQAGTVLARAGLLTVPPTANFKAKEIRRSLQQAADRSQRFWVSLVGEEEAVAVATEFVGIIGDLVLAEREAANRLPERAESLWRYRRRPAWPPPPPAAP